MPEFDAGFGWFGLCDYTAVSDGVSNHSLFANRFVFFFGRQHNQVGWFTFLNSITILDLQRSGTIGSNQVNRVNDLLVAN